MDTTTEIEKWLVLLEGDEKRIENKEMRDAVLIALKEMIMAIWRIEVVEYPSDRHKRMSIAKKDFRDKVATIMGEPEMLNLLGKGATGESMFSTCGDVSQ